MPISLPEAALPFLRLDAPARLSLTTASDKLPFHNQVFSALTVARTFADLAGRDAIAPTDLAEAIQHARPLL